MTAPRQVRRGASYLVTRRCFHRQFLLKPSALTNAVFRYLLAVAAQRTGVLVHAFCVLSNHYHLVLTDPDARLPDFGRFLDGLVARVLNASHGRWETFWAPSTYSAVVLPGPEDLVEKVAYTLANPVAAGLVQDAADWPGLWSDPASFGAPAEIVERPDFFFATDGSMPAVEKLELVAPPGFASVNDYRRRVLDRLTARVDEAVRTVKASGGGFLGPRKVLAQKHWARPATREKRRGLRPRVAAVDKWRRVEVLNRLEEFRTRYREAWAAFRAGVRDVVFPAGTYQPRVAFGVACADTG